MSVCSDPASYDPVARQGLTTACSQHHTHRSVCSLSRPDPTCVVLIAGPCIGTLLQLVMRTPTSMYDADKLLELAKAAQQYKVLHTHTHTLAIALFSSFIAAR